MSMSTAALLDAVYTDLQAWAATLGGHVSLARDPFDLLEVLGNRPAGFRLVLYYAGDSKADPSVRTGTVVQHVVRIIPHIDLGPTKEPLIALFRRTSARQLPLLELTDLVWARVMRYRIAGLTPPNDGFWYEGLRDGVPLPDGSTLAAYNMEFRIRAARPWPDRDEKITLNPQT